MTGDAAQKRRWQEKRTSLKERGIQLMWSPGVCVPTYYAQKWSGIMRLFRQSRGVTDKFRRGREEGVDVMEFG